MFRVLSNPQQYSDLWEKESELINSHGIYEKLSKLTPTGNVLEIGCGIGLGTRHLSSGRSVLSLEGNEFLIRKAESLLDSDGIPHQIHKCDFFSLSAEDRRRIIDFEPAVIVGWFIGSHGEDILKHTQEEMDLNTKPKLYREKIEDIITSRDVCVDSVTHIHLVSRVGRISGFDESFYFKETKDDYDKHVFSPAGFEVIDVTHIDWPREGSDFQYGQAANPNLAQGEAIPTITSIIAKRSRRL